MYQLILKKMVSVFALGLIYIETKETKWQDQLEIIPGSYYLYF